MVKFSSKLEEALLKELRAHAEESGKNISTVLSEAVADYLAKVRVRPAFLDAAEKVVEQNKELLTRLAK